MPAQMTPLLRLKNFSLRRGRAILTDLSWTVNPGERWVILGPNGCGKTSLLNALTGYMTPVDGTMELLGETYGETDWRELRAKIGLVSTSLLPRVEPGEKAWEVVMSGRYAQINFWGTPAADDRGRARNLLTRVEAEGLEESPWEHLSAGERQRVLIARALNAEPSLLFLDEPCAHLDPVARERFLLFLEHFSLDGTPKGATAPARSAAEERPSPGAASGAAFVLVTHHLEEVGPSVTHALLLKAGRAVAAGTVEVALTAEKLGDAFGAAVDVRRDGGRWAMRVRSTSFS